MAAQRKISATMAKQSTMMRDVFGFVWMLRKASNLPLEFTASNVKVTRVTMTGTKARKQIIWRIAVLLGAENKNNFGDLLLGSMARMSKATEARPKAAAVMPMIAGGKTCNLRSWTSVMLRTRATMLSAKQAVLQAMILHDSKKRDFICGLTSVLVSEFCSREDDPEVDA
ncbi:hypothetical protein FRC20_002789 [Serendipita sp. 405]|nr:hypothetical protein FRC20_002789 [Serendipita sp. 405]